MRIAISPWRNGRILKKAVLLAAVAHALVFPVPRTAHATPVFIAQLHGDLRLTDTGRIVRTDGIRLATLAGTALINPAMPVTLPSELPEPRRDHEYGSPAARRPRPAIDVPFGTTFTVTSTAYSSTPDQTDASPFITASGARVHQGTIAVNFLPFGTKVTFPEYSDDRVYIVEDRTHARFSSRADIWFSSRAQAMQFGKRTLTMVVVE